MRARCSKAAKLALAVYVVLLHEACSEPWSGGAAEMVTAIRSNLRTGCVQLVHTSPLGMGDFLQLVRAQGALSRLQTASAVLLDPGTATTCRQGRPLNVILLPPTHSSLHLNQQPRDAFWLLFPTENISTADLLDDVTVPADCLLLVAERSGNNGFILTEAFHIGQNVHSSSFGSWSPKSGLETVKQSLFERRHFHGMKLLAAVKEVMPYVKIRYSSTNVLSVHGSFGHVWNILQKELNFTTHFVVPPDNAWGSLLPNGSWNGALGMVARGDVEAAVSDFTMTTARMDVVDYTVPLISFRYFVFIKKQATQSMDWTGYLSPFSLKLWLSLLGSMACFVLVLLLVYRFGPSRRLQEATVGDVILEVFGLFCQAVSTEPSRRSSSRAAHLLAHLLAVVLLAAYAGALVSFLTIHKDILPFSSLEQLLSRKDYQLGVIAKSATFSDFSNASTPLQREIYSRHIAPHEDTLPTSHKGGLDRVCSSPHNYAFVASGEIAHLLQPQLSCHVGSIPGTLDKKNMGLIVRRGSPLKAFLNHRINALRRNGVLHKLNPWSTRPQQQSASPWNDMHLSHIGVLLVTLSASIALASSILVAERWWDRRKGQRSTKEVDRHFAW